MRRLPAGDRPPLLDAEPMLLVHDRDGDLGEIDAFLDQRMRADEDLRRGGIVLHRASEQRDLDSELATRLLEGEEVLLGQRLRRRHQCALLAGLDRA